MGFRFYTYLYGVYLLVVDVREINTVISRYLFYKKSYLPQTN